jgi:uridine kinase
MGLVIHKLIGIAGGSGSGKTTLALEAQRMLGPERCTILSQDHYYFDQSKHFDADGGKVNFDHPNSIDFDLMVSHLKLLREGRSIELPIYDFATHSRLPRTQNFVSKDFIIVEGTLILTQAHLRELLDESFFIDTPERIRFERRLRRDVEERGRDPEGVRKQFDLQVRPMHEQFVEPSKSHAKSVISSSFYSWMSPLLR